MLENPRACRLRAPTVTDWMDRRVALDEGGIGVWVSFVTRSVNRIDGTTPFAVYRELLINSSQHSTLVD